MRTRHGILAIATAIGIAACGSDGTTAPARSGDSLRFLRVSGPERMFTDTTTSVWVAYDHASHAQIVYRAIPGAADSVVLVDFAVPAQSLAMRPDGSEVGPGDSVLVTITITDPAHMIVRFEPSGLRFSPSRPAQLRLALGVLDRDLNGDGRVDAADEALRSQLHIWRQEHAGEPWAEMPSFVDVTRSEVAADIPGFTNYAVAY